MLMIQTLASGVEQWLRQEALPLWTTHGLDQDFGGVIEAFALDGRTPAPIPFKRARVSCRQVYVFSHAQVLGWRGADAAADHAYQFLVNRFWQGEGAGWVRRVTPRGAIEDGTPDLYDYAFALFALGWRYRATGDHHALGLAHRTMDIIDARFRHPGGHGFHNELPAALPRQQNPHMHLMEAALVLAEVADDQRFLALADELATLFKTRLARFPEGVLPEFFDDDWRPVAGEKGRWIEPGHLFEWAWILAQHAKVSGADHVSQVRALVAWAERHGVDPKTGFTVNGVRDDGVPIDAGTRTWPNTERIKGWLGLYELTGEDPTTAVVEATNVLMDRIFGLAPAGAWIDAFNSEGLPSVATIPTSTLYHVFLAFSEVLRLAPSLAEIEQNG
jgi:mannose/cellobiose epimerase-like protein (N-acyl-D-glucosamine 2-epimerase family)